MNDCNMDEYIINIDKNSAVCLEGPQYQTIINHKNVYFREGTWLEKDENNELTPDWSLTWFYENPEKPEDYLYYEQDPPETALTNLRNAMKINNAESIQIHPEYEREYVCA